MLKAFSLSRLRVASRIRSHASSAGTRGNDEVERRRDTDGVLYTRAQFEEFYGGDSEGVPYKRWSAAKHFDHKLTKDLKAATGMR